jgi:hypothetical protein
MYCFAAERERERERERETEKPIKYSSLSYIFQLTSISFYLNIQLILRLMLNLSAYGQQKIPIKMFSHWRIPAE